MRHIKTSVFLVGALALAGCGNNGVGGLFGGGDDADAQANAALSSGVGAIEETSIDFFNTSVGDRVLFEVDRHTLTPQAVAVLDGQATWLLNNPSYTIVIEGHADEQGTRDYNLALSARRASSVYNYLLSRGLTESRMTTSAFGKERPLAVCSDETCWSKNRRAVTVVSGGAALGS
jgi:peptidoglycan-associated lipoprotein